MKIKQNVFLGFILVSFCAISFYIGLKINSNRKVNEVRGTCKHKLCAQIDNIINLLSCTNKLNKNDDKLDKPIINSSKLSPEPYCTNDTFEEITVVTRDERDIEFLNTISQPFNLLCNCFHDDIFISNCLTCTDFLNNEIISENEVSFIHSFREDIQGVLKKLTLE